MTAMTPPSLDPTTSKVVSISTQIMIGAVVVLFFVVAFFFFLHLYVKCYRSTDAEDRSIVSWRRQLAQQRRRTSSRLNRQGLDPAALQALPVMVYDPKEFKEGLECAVCLSELSEGEKVRLLPKCNHGFHVDCIDMWFQSHSTCPLCRNPVISSPTTSNGTNTSSEMQDYNSSDSSDDSDDDHNDSNNTPRAREVANFPANVLFWGNETRVSIVGQSANASASTSASSSGVNRSRNNQEMVIEIPLSHQYCDDCLSSSPRLEETKTPVMTRLASLKRLWSLGKRVASPSPKASSSRDVDHQV